MKESEKSYYIWLDKSEEVEEIPAWKQLELVVRKWVVMSQMEKDLNDYQKRKKQYN